MHTREESPEEIPQLPEPETYVHRLLSQMGIEDGDGVSLVDISKHKVIAPGYGALVGENEYVVGSGVRNPAARFLVTDKILHCTGISISDTTRDMTVLAHLYHTRNTEALFQTFLGRLPENAAFDITVVPGYQVTLASSERVKSVIEVARSLNPRSLWVDIANGDPRSFRGIRTDTLTGGVAELAGPIEGAQVSAYMSAGQRIF